MDLLYSHCVASRLAAGKKPKFRVFVSPRPERFIIGRHLSHGLPVLLGMSVRELDELLAENELTYGPDLSRFNVFFDCTPRFLQRGYLSRSHARELARALLFRYQRFTLEYPDRYPEWFAVEVTITQDGREYLSSAPVEGVLDAAIAGLNDRDIWDRWCRSQLKKAAQLIAKKEKPERSFHGLPMVPVLVRRRRATHALLVNIPYGLTTIIASRCQEEHRSVAKKRRLRTESADALAGHLDGWLRGRRRSGRERSQLLWHAACLLWSKGLMERVRGLEHGETVVISIGGKPGRHRCEIEIVPDLGGLRRWEPMIVCVV